MADIFISWGKDDAVSVDRIVTRFRQLGFGREADQPPGASGPTLWEYTHDMGAGDVIQRQVENAIESARIAILCLSDQVAGRDWIITETAWCLGALDRRVLKHVIPVKVGPMSDAAIPARLRERGLNVADLSAGDEGALYRFVTDVLRKLGRNEPQVLPAALFAMTKSQCQQLIDTAVALGVLADLCTAVGMSKPPLLYESLRDRYGDTPEGLVPFRSSDTLIDLVNRAVAEINASRVQARKRPMFVRWLHQDLSADAGPDRQAARDLWRSGDSLLVVDSLSVVHTEVSKQLNELPEPADPRRAALLWLPPFTRHTAALEPIVPQAAMLAGRIGDACADWDRQPERQMSFDPTTSVGVRVWLKRAFINLPDTMTPLQGNVAAMRGSSPASATSLSDLFDATNVE